MLQRGSGTTTTVAFFFFFGDVIVAPKLSRIMRRKE